MWLRNLLVVLGLLLCSTGEAGTIKHGYVMPWMCLEICDSAEAVQEQLADLRKHADVLSGVSFERYTLADDCKLVTLDYVSDVRGAVAAMGLDTWPMITSYPHPDEFITWMRKLYFDASCGDAFIQQARAEASKFGYTGFNLDFEPTRNNVTAPITKADSAAYAAFVGRFATALHADGVKLGVDVAQWKTAPDGPSIWDYNALATTAVDKGISMGTYCSNDDTFQKEVEATVAAFGPRAGIGLQRINASDNSLFSDEEVAFRFRTARAAGVTEIDIWDTPVPQNFWKHVTAFALGLPDPSGAA